MSKDTSTRTGTGGNVWRPGRGQHVETCEGVGGGWLARLMDDDDIRDGYPVPLAFASGATREEAAEAVLIHWHRENDGDGWTCACGQDNYNADDECIACGADRPTEPDPSDPANAPRLTDPRDTNVADPFNIPPEYIGGHRVRASLLLPWADAIEREVLAGRLTLGYELDDDPIDEGEGEGDDDGSGDNYMTEWELDPNDPDQTAPAGLIREKSASHDRHGEASPDYDLYLTVREPEPTPARPEHFAPDDVVSIDGAPVAVVVGVYYSDQRIDGAALGYVLAKRTADAYARAPFVTWGCTGRDIYAGRYDLTLERGRRDFAARVAAWTR